MDGRAARVLAEGDTKTRKSRCTVALLDRATDVIDAVSKLVHSCVRLVRALTALVVALAVLYLIAHALW